LAVRWKTVRCSATCATIGVICIPDEPVPMMPTRLPVSSTPSRGQTALCTMRPVKRCCPGSTGAFVVDRLPTAITSSAADHSSPASVCTCHRARCSS